MPPKFQIPIALSNPHARRKPHIIQPQRPRERHAKLRIRHPFPNAAARSDAERTKGGSCERHGIGCYGGRGVGNPARRVECEWGGEVGGVVVDSVMWRA